jgi:hypothetical protein
MGNVFASCCGPSSADAPQRWVKLMRSWRRFARAVPRRRAFLPRPSLQSHQSSPQKNTHPQPKQHKQPLSLGGGPTTERDRAAQQRAAEQAEARQRAFEQSAVGRAAVRAVKEAKGQGPAGAGGGSGVGSSSATNSGPTAQDWLN